MTPLVAMPDGPLMYGGLSALDFILRKIAEEDPNEQVSPFQSYIDDTPEE